MSNQASNKLRFKLERSCINQGIELVTQIDKITNEGMQLFDFNAKENKVISKNGLYDTVDDFVTANMPGDTTQGNRMNLLAKAAESGNMKEFRRLRNG